MLGLQKVEDDDLVPQLLGQLPIGGLGDAADMESLVGAIRAELKRRGPSDPRIAVKRRGVVDMFTEIQVALRHVARMRGAEDDDERIEAELAAQHFGYALSQAFAAGVVTALPPESREVFQALANSAKLSGGAQEIITEAAGAVCERSSSDTGDLAATNHQLCERVL